MSERTNFSTLEVSTNHFHEVVLNLPRDMTGNMAFSPQQARLLADALLRKVHEAETAHLAELEAKRRADAPPVDRSALCTTDGRPPEEARASQTNETGQHPSYIVLCAEERAKGFVRPYRDAYKHVGPLTQLVNDAGEDTHLVRSGGCGRVTTMGRALSETYARDPSFYGATFCVTCNQHFPVAEFVWTADGAQVGS
jgi:hypothetical protein